MSFTDGIVETQTLLALKSGNMKSLLVGFVFKAFSLVWWSSYSRAGLIVSTLISYEEQGACR